MSKAAQERMTASYKSLKEDFVSGLTGGSIREINFVTAAAPVRFLLPLLRSPTTSLLSFLWIDIKMEERANDVVR
jgi:hypothetical protein